MYGNHTTSGRGSAEQRDWPLSTPVLRLPEIVGEKELVSGKVLRYRFCTIYGRFRLAATWRWSIWGRFRHVEFVAWEKDFTRLASERVLQMKFWTFSPENSKAYQKCRKNRNFQSFPQKWLNFQYFRHMSTFFGFWWKLTFLMEYLIYLTLSKFRQKCQKIQNRKRVENCDISDEIFDIPMRFLTILIFAINISMYLAKFVIIQYF